MTFNQVVRGSSPRCLIVSRAGLLHRCSSLVLRERILLANHMWESRCRDSKAVAMEDDCEEETDAGQLRELYVL